MFLNIKCNAELMFLAVCWKKDGDIPSGPRDFETSKDDKKSLICFEMQ